MNNFKFNTFNITLIGVIVILVGIVGYLYFKKPNVEKLEEMPKPPPSAPSNGAVPTLIMFYADWCPHCKSMMGPWDQLEKGLKGKINVVKIEDKEIDRSKFQLKGYPTIRFYPYGLNDPRYSEYSGDRSPQDILRFIQTGGVPQPPLNVPSP